MPKISWEQVVYALLGAILVILLAFFLLKYLRKHKEGKDIVKDKKDIENQIWSQTQVKKEFTDIEQEKNK